MKKKFSLLMLALLSIVGLSYAALRAGETSLMIQFADAEGKPVALSESFSAGVSGEFVLTRVDVNNKHAIDENNAWFGDATAQQKFTARLKTGGKSSSNSSMTLTIPADGTLKVYVRTGKNSETDRTLILTQGETELYNKVVQESDAVEVDMGGEALTKVYPIISVPVVAGTVAVAYPVNGLNFYGFEFVPAAEETQDTWTVAGNNEDLFGTAWDPTNTANDMTLSEGVYVWSKSEVTLPAGKVEFKVCKDHAWDEAYPDQNYELNIAESGIYTISITFDPATQAVNATATKTGNAEEQEPVAQDTWTVAGNNTDLFGTAWDPTNTANDMTLSVSEGVYVWSKSEVTLPAGNVAFKVCKNHTWDEAYPGSDYVLNIAESGIYTISITFDPATQAVNATATKTGNAEVSVDYFLVGTFNNWTQKDENYKLVKNEAAEVEEYSITIDLEANAEFKVISSTSTWYPGGANLSVQAAGNYTIYFRPVANEDWGGNIFVQANGGETSAEGIVPNGTYYVMNANLGTSVNAEGATDAKGAPITFTFDATTESYTIAGADFFAEKQWTVAKAYEDMGGFFYITTVVEGATKYLTADAEGKLALADAADDNAVWIVLEKAYWEDIMNSTYTVAGTKNLTGTEEDWQIAEANQMKYNEETKLFEITFNNITVNNEVKPEFKVVKTPMEGENIWYPLGDNSNWVITPEYLGGEGEYDITITFDPSDSKEIGVTGLKIADINITLESGSDIYEALIAAEMSVKPRNITINLVEGGNYTISGPLSAYANFEIQGNGATIDASGLSNNFIQMVTTDNPAVTVPVEYVSIHNATIKGLKKPLFYSTQKGYLINWLTIDNSIIEVAADATTIDFTKGSAARNFNIENSTIYAPTATTKSFYSSQGGQKLTELDAEGIQTFIVKNSTMYNLAKGKNFFTHRQSNQKWLAYDVENSIFVNCGKSGQVIKGMNGGQSGTNPTWTIKGNAFNFEADGVMTDTSAAEDTGDTTEGEGVQNSVAGVVTFTDAANGDFNGEFQLAEGATAPEALGDGRWTITFKGGAEVETTYYLVGTFNNWTASDTYKLTLNENADEGVVEYMLTLDIPANSSMKVLDNIGNWYPATGPDFVVNDEGNFTVYFRPNGDGDESWFEGCIYCKYNGEPVGINTVKADNLKGAQIFNLAGQRVENAQKGLYIVNGKKVLVK